MIVYVDGLPLSGKTEFIKTFVKEGFEHKKFPIFSNKFFEQGYVGPSLSNLWAEFLTFNQHKKIIIEGSWLYELFLSSYEGRSSYISSEELEVLQSQEGVVDIVKVFMIDKNSTAHAERLKNVRSPLTLDKMAKALQIWKELITDVGSQYHYVDISDFDSNSEIYKKIMSIPINSPKKEAKVLDVNLDQEVEVNIENEETSTLNEQEILNQANIINEILSGKILKKNGEKFQFIEDKIKIFLQVELKTILNLKRQINYNLSNDEILFIKSLYKQTTKKGAK